MIEIYTDGGARNNPGPIRYGFIAYKNGNEIYRKSSKKNFGTNNEAEMLAILDAVKWCHGEMTVIMYSDSLLAINWITGNWKCNKEHIIVIKDMIMETINKGQLYNICFKKIPREENKAHEVGGW